MEGAGGRKTNKSPLSLGFESPTERLQVSGAESTAGSTMPLHGSEHVLAEHDYTLPVRDTESSCAQGPSLHGESATSPEHGASVGGRKIIKARRKFSRDTPARRDSSSSTSSSSSNGKGGDSSSSNGSSGGSSSSSVLGSSLEAGGTSTEEIKRSIPMRVVLLRARQTRTPFVFEAMDPTDTRDTSRMKNLSDSSSSSSTNSETCEKIAAEEPRSSKFNDYALLSEAYQKAVDPLEENQKEDNTWDVIKICVEAVDCRHSYLRSLAETEFGDEYIPADPFGESDIDTSSGNLYEDSSQHKLRLGDVEGALVHAYADFASRESKPRDSESPPPKDSGSPPPKDSGSPPPKDSGSPPPKDSGSPPPKDSGSPPPKDSGSPPPKDQEDQKDEKVLRKFTLEFIRDMNKKAERMFPEEISSSDESNECSNSETRVRGSESTSNKGEQGESHGHQDYRKIVLEACNAASKSHKKGLQYHEKISEFNSTAEHYMKEMIATYGLFLTCMNCILVTVKPAVEAERLALMARQKMSSLDSARGGTIAQHATSASEFARSALTMAEQAVDLREEVFGDLSDAEHSLTDIQIDESISEDYVRDINLVKGGIDSLVEDMSDVSIVKKVRVRSECVKYTAGNILCALKDAEGDWDEMNQLFIKSNGARKDILELLKSATESSLVALEAAAKALEEWSALKVDVTTPGGN